MGKQRHHRHPRAAPVHFNPQGHKCHCPFGDPRKEKFVSRHDREAVGSVRSSIWVEAAKADWLRDRPDVKEEPLYQQFLDKIEAHYPEHDPLYPWLLREYKKGRIRDQEPSNLHVGLGYTHDDGRYRPELSSDHLDQVSEWMKYMKQAKKGVDIMKHEIGPALKEAEKNDEGGETVHDFTGDEDANPHGYYDGWTMKRLRNARDMVKEGDRMSHCIGGGGRGGYIEKNNEGKGAYYSLRTDNNEPVATLEMTPKAEHYFMCPTCKKPAFGVRDYSNPDEDGHYSLNCEHCQEIARELGDPSRETRLGAESRRDYNYESGQYDYTPPKPAEGVKMFPTKINHKKPTNDHMDAAQLFGESDKKLDQDHEELVNHWLSKHGHPYYHSDGDEDYEDEEEEHYEPWWDDEYHVPGAETMDQFMNHHVNGEYYEDAPEEYHRAMADANEHSHIDGVQEPELYLGSPDVPSIFRDMADTMSGYQKEHHGPSAVHHVDPHQIADMFKHMSSEGYGDEWHNTAQEWLDDEYNPYLDPYGAQGGSGDMTKGRGDITGPPDNPEERGERGFAQQTPGDIASPELHYPNPFPGDELFAKNLQYHLDQARDPQTGEVVDEYQRNNRYPQVSPSHGTLPNIPQKEHVPIADQTGVDIQRPEDRAIGETQPEWARNRYRRPTPIHLPYGRDVPFDDPMSGPLNQERFEGITWNRDNGPSSEAYNQQRPLDAFRPERPNGPEQAFGEEDTRFHQRPLPGTQGYDPMALEEYPSGEQQGQLMPAYWYRKGSRLQHAELPPELYPPGTLMSSSYRPDMMGDNYGTVYKYAPGEPGRVLQKPPQEPTHPMWHPYRDDSSIWTQAPIDETMHERPKGDWVAKTASPWSEFMQQNGVEPHPGIPHLGGKVVESNLSDYFELPGHEWRRPVVYHQGEDRLYVGQPGMEHTDFMHHMGKSSPWQGGMPRQGMVPGYIDLTKKLGEGGLHFFQSSQVPQEDRFHDWVEDRFSVRRPESVNELTDEDWVSASVEPRTYEQIYGPPPNPEQYDSKNYMASKREYDSYHAEKNPLQWTPGAKGKAFLDQENNLHTWNDDSLSRFWTHNSQAEMRGVYPKYYTTVYLGRDGEVKDDYGRTRGSEDSNELYRQLKQYHPGVYWPAKDAPEETQQPYEDEFWESKVAVAPPPSLCSNCAAPQARGAETCWKCGTPQTPLPPGAAPMELKIPGPKKTEMPWYGRVPLEGEIGYERYKDTRQEWQDYQNSPRTDLWSGHGPGKAFLDQDGKLHTWDEDVTSPFWTHGDQANMRGVRPEYDTTIYMDEDGAVDDRYGQARNAPGPTKRLYDKLKIHHPGTTWPAIDDPDQDQEEFEDDLWHDASYHPRQNDEWVAGDEPDFSVVVPEPRWG